MFKQKLHLEVKGKEDRVYRLECEPNSPLGEIHDALCAMKNVVVQQIVKIQESDKKPDQEPEKQDEE